MSNNVLFITGRDFCGVGGLYAKALEVVGYKTRVLAFNIKPDRENIRPWGKYILVNGYHLQAKNENKSYRQWIPNPQTDENTLNTSVQWADYIIFMHSTMVSIKHTGKRCFVFHTGSNYRQHFYRVHKFFHPIVEKTIVDTPDLLTFGPKNGIWIPPPMPLDLLMPNYNRVNSNKMVLGHFFARESAKGSTAIAEVFRCLPNNVKEKFALYMPKKEIPWARNIERVRKSCDIVIDGLQLTSRGKRYGAWCTAALEAATLGKVVLSHFLDQELYEKQFGSLCPIMPINSLKQLRETLIEISKWSPEHLRHRKEQFRLWVETYNTFEYIGNYFKEKVFND